MKSLLILLIGVLTLFSLQAQTEWEHFLFPSQVNDIQDIDGKLWIATNVGLYEVDKTTENVIYHDRANAGLPSLTVEGITEDAQGRKWIGTYDKRVAMLENNTWSTFEVPSDLFEIGQFDPDPLFYCIKSFNNAIWIGTNYGMLKFENNDWSLLDIDTASFFLDDVWSMHVANDNLYAAGNLAYQYSESDGWSSLDDSMTFELFAYSDAHIYESKDYGVFFVTDIGTVGVYADDEVTIYSSHDTGDLEIPIFLNQVSSISGNSEAGIFINSGSQGIIKFNGNRWEEVEIETAEPSLIQYYFIDNDNKHWYVLNGVLYNPNNEPISLVDHGLISNQVTRVDIGATPMAINNRVPINLNDWTYNDQINQSIYGIDNSHEGKLYLCGNESILIVDENNSITEIEYPNVSNFGFATDIVAFADNDIWILSYRIVLHYDGESWTTIQSVQEGSFRNLVKGDDGDVFFTTINTNGICSSNTNVYHALTGGQTNVTHFCGYNLLKKAANGAIYLATRDGYLNEYKYASDSWVVNDFSEIIEEMGYVYDFDVRLDSSTYFATYTGLVEIVNEEQTIYNLENSLLYRLPTEIDIDEDNSKVWLVVPSAGLQTFSITSRDTSTVTSLSNFEKNHFNVYPNPTSKYLNFDLQDFGQKSSIQIIDELGRVVVEVENNQTNNLSVDVQHLAKGIYFVLLKDGVKQYSVEWMKQ